jgi:HK97 family phage major capsid protein
MTDTEHLTFSSSIFAEGRRLRGSVQLAGQQTPRNGELVEVDPGALVRADASGAVVVVGHQAGADMSLGYDPLRTVARMDNGSLRLTRTDQGFDYETEPLPNTSAANDALELAKAGIFGGTSFDISGLKSTFSTAADGTRVRRYTSIQTLGAVTPVVEPAFPSSVAVFSKEKAVTEPIVEEPKAAPPIPAPAPVITEQPKPAAEWTAFAKDLSTEQIEASMDQVFAASKGELKGELLDRYEGFSTELQRRKREDAEARGRVERMTTLHNLRLGRVPKAPDAEVFASDDYKAAFSRFLRTGDKVVMEQFTGQAIAGDGTQGGYMVPTDFRNTIIETKKAYGGIQRIADSIDTGDGRDLPWPTNDDTSNSAAIATEGAAVGSGGADLVLGQEILQAFTYDATGASNNPLLVSKELLQDAAFDVEGFVGRKLGERLGRKMAADYATGSGSGAPFGLFTKSADVMTATTLYLALSEHLFQVDQAYRESGNCRWVFSDTVLALVYNSTDTTKRPLFTPMDQSGGQTGPAGTLLGYPVTLDQGAGSNVAFGDIRAGFIIRNVKGVMVDVDPYTAIKSRQVAFHAWARTDSAVQDSAAFSVSSYSGVSATS